MTDIARIANAVQAQGNGQLGASLGKLVEGQRNIVAAIRALATPVAGLGWFNIQDAAFGATGDGATDDMAALKLAAAAIRAAGGGILYAPRGVYLTSDKIWLPEKTVVLGDGRGATTFRRKSSSVTDATASHQGAIFGVGTADDTPYLVSSHASFVAFQDCTIDGNYTGNPGVTSNTPHADGIDIYYTDYVHCVRVEFINCLNSGSYLFGCRRSYHGDCIARNNGQLGGAGSRNGFSISGPQDDATDRDAQDEHTFVACRAIGNVDEGFAIGRNGWIQLLGCVARENGDAGIEGDSGTATSDTTNVPAGWVISGCTVYNNTLKGITIANSNAQRIVISGTLVEQHPRDGIILTLTSGALLDISGTTVVQCGTSSSSYHGVTIGTFDHVVLNGLLIDGGGGTSLGTGLVFLTQAAVRSIDVAGVKITGHAGGGVSLTGTAKGRLSVQVDTTGTAASDGVTISGGANGVDNLNLDDCFVKNATDRGFFIRTNGAGNLTNIRMRNCTATGCVYGLECTESTGTITGLILDGNDFAGNSSGTTTGVTTAMLAQPSEDLNYPGGYRQTIDGWTQDNVAASQTNVELTRATGRFRAARAGSVTAVLATLTEARTAGTLTVDVFKNTGLAGAAGSSIGLTAVIDGTNTSRKATTQAKDTDAFAAGDELYAVVTTDGSWLPTTSDLRVAIEVED